MHAWRIELDAPEPVRPLLEKHMDIFRYRGRPEVDSALLGRLVAQAAPDARQLLATEGYFNPEVAAAMTPENGIDVVRIHALPGQAAMVTAVDIRITGDIAGKAGESGRVARIERSWSMPPGSAFRQAAWDNAKNALLRGLIFEGYPAARIAASMAEVDPGSDTVIMAVTIDSGPLVRFGTLDITGLERYPRAIVENLQPFGEGDRYDYDSVLRYQSILQASGYFRNASVTVDINALQAGMAPVLVRVTEHPAMKIDLGAGYSTDTGARGEAAFAHNNAFRPGWQGQTRMRLEAKQQILDAELALSPEASGWRNRLGAQTARSDVENLVSRRVGLSAGRAWRTAEREHDWTLKFQAEEQALTAGPVDNLTALTLNYSWTLRQLNDLLRPRRGYMLNLQLGGASESMLSTRSFARGYGRSLYILPLGRNDRLHLRAELGAVWAEARDGIPNEFLFRAGGDQSVRGYAYQSIGVIEGAAVIGARYLGTATVEYQRDFTAQWGGALFVDAGDAKDSPSRLRPVYGYGAGLRWITPAGTVNLDLARAQETGKLRLHFTLGARF